SDSARQASFTGCAIMTVTRMEFVAALRIPFLAAMLLSAGALANGLCGEEPTGDLAQYYGFDRLELYKLQQRSTNLQAADLNHDGRIDLILVDNSNSRLDLLIQRDPAAFKGDAPAARARVNNIENDKRFEHKKLPVDREVASLSVGDFNGDGRKDLAYFAL